MTEFEVRRMAARIADSDLQPMAKVRDLIWLARSIKLRARALIHARDQSMQAHDSSTAAHLDRVIARLHELYDDVRLEAHRILRTVTESRAVVLSPA